MSKKVKNKDDEVKKDTNIQEKNEKTIKQNEETIKQDEIDILQKIKENRKLPKEIKKKMRDAICDCALSAIIVYVYFIFLGLGIKNIHHNIYLTDLRVFSVSLSIIAVIFYENSYQNKILKPMWRGIEITILAILTLFIQYMILYLTPNYRIIIPMLGILYNVYYILKSIIMCINIKNAYRKESSDIKEIVKKEKKI